MQDGWHHLNLNCREREWKHLPSRTKHFLKIFLQFWLRQQKIFKVLIHAWKRAAFERLQARSSASLNYAISTTRPIYDSFNVHCRTLLYIEPFLYHERNDSLIVNRWFYNRVIWDILETTEGEQRLKVYFKHVQGSMCLKCLSVSLTCQPDSLYVIGSSQKSCRSIFVEIISNQLLWNDLMPNDGTVGHQIVLYMHKKPNLPLL